MRFLPKRPYRCLHCYHRFWKGEPFFASQSRVVSWLGVIALLMGLGFLPNWNVDRPDKPEPFSDFGSAPNAVPGQPPAELLASNWTAKPVYVDDPASLNANLDSDGNVDEEEVKADSFADPASNKPTGRLSSSQATADTKKLVELNSVDEVANPAALLEQLYTTQQLQQRLSLAKATAEQAEENNLQTRARLQQTIATEQDELQSLLKVDINFRIDQWRKAWEVGFVDDYLSFYSEQFTPASELEREQWVAQRKQRIRPSKKIDLVMDNFDVVFASDNTVSTVSFDQRYRSGRYVESSRKQLVLHKQQQEWKIMSETEVAIEAPKETAKVRRKETPKEAVQ